MHELLGQKLAHAGAQHSAAIGTAAVGRGATTLELHLPTPAMEDTFKHGDGPTIAIAIAVAERALLGVFRTIDRQGVASGPAQRPHRLLRGAAIAGEQTAEPFFVHQCSAEAELIEQGRAVGHVLRRRQGSRFHRHVMAAEHLTGPVVVAIAAGLRIRPQAIQQRVVGPLRKCLERGDRRGCGRGCLHGCLHGSAGIGAIRDWPGYQGVHPGDRECPLS